MPRRYKVGTHKDYDKHFDAEKVASPLLNPNRMEKEPRSEASLKFFWGMAQKNSVESLLQEYQGHLAKARRKLQAVMDEFEIAEARAKRLGNAPPEPDKRLVEERFKREAIVDIIADEVAKLEKRFKEFEDREAAKPENQVLPYGPAGAAKCSRMVDGNLASIDGQVVKYNGGEPFIDDKRSPYDKMKVSDYKRLIVLPFKKIRREWSGKLEDLPPRPEEV